jgi:DNA repair exonuclease SbcCD ATPase subunit
MSDTSETDLQELPSMSEKVKFWEEQDKINQALIPRVIEMAETLEDLSEEIAKINDRISSTEARIKQDVSKSREERLEEIEGDLRRLNRALVNLQKEGGGSQKGVGQDFRRVKLMAQFGAVLSVTAMIALLVFMFSLS